MKDGRQVDREGGALGGAALVLLGWLGVAGLLLFVALIGVAFASVVGIAGGVVLALLLAIVIQCFLLSHPAQAYVNLLVQHEYLSASAFANVQRGLRTSVFVSLAVQAVAYFGFVCPAVLRECVPTQGYVPFRACELVLVFFIFALLVKRAAYALTVSQEAAIGGIAGLGRESVAGAGIVRRYGNVIFLSVFVLAAFLLMFVHLALAADFYEQSPLGVASCVGLTASFMLFSLGLDWLLPVRH